jgi:hypothetical protein
MKLIRTTLAGAIAMAAALPMSSQAATDFDTGAGALSATADLTFNVVIPRFIFLRVGSAVPATVNTLVFAPTVDEMANSTPILGTGGDATASDVTIVARGNAGNMTLAASNPTNLVSGGNNIPVTTLTGTNQTGSIGVPAFGGSVALTAGGNGVFNQSGTWRYSWTNPAATVYPAGTYVATATYTLSAP